MPPVEIGFMALKDVFDQRVEEIGVEVLRTAITETTTQHQMMTTALVTAMVEITTDFKKVYRLPGGGTLQPLDEFGRPKKVDYSASYEVAVPIRHAGTAWGATEEALAHLTVEEAAEKTDDALRRDWNWQKRHILSAIFTDTTYVFSDPEAGNLTIRGLADGDSTVYLKEGIEDPAMDNHYLAQAAAIDNSNNPFPTIYADLAEHASNRVSEANPIVVYIPTNLKATIMALSTFVEVSPFFVTQANTSDRLEDDLTRFLAFGTEIIGVCDSCIIAEMKSMPSSYMIAHATGGGPVVYQREYVPASLKGLQTKEVVTDGTLTDFRWIRRAGYAVFNRIGAMAILIGASPYVEPTGYIQPLKV